eukprot:5577108-Pyramimonas_sp.AAC.1
MKSDRKAEEIPFKDVCLVDSFRAHRFKVPYVSDGPFWALKDGRAMLAPFGISIVKVPEGISGIDGMSKCVVHDPEYPTRKGPVEHFQALKKVDGELLLADTHLANSFRPLT